MSTPRAQGPTVSLAVNRTYNFSQPRLSCLADISMKPREALLVFGYKKPSETWKRGWQFLMQRGAVLVDRGGIQKTKRVKLREGLKGELTRVLGGKEKK